MCGKWYVDYSLDESGDDQEEETKERYDSTYSEQGNFSASPFNAMILTSLLVERDLFCAPI